MKALLRSAAQLLPASSLVPTFIDTRPSNETRKQLANQNDVSVIGWRRVTFSDAAG